MKRVIMVAVLLIIFSSVVTACGSGTKQAVPCEDSTVPIEVKFTWTPENPSENEEVVFSAHVTHNGVNIDSDEHMQDIHFEIWEHNNADYHHYVPAEHEGDGVYTLDWSFETEGVYYAYYHVTACHKHRMEKEQIIVGSPDVEAITKEEDAVKLHMDHDHSEH